VSKSGYSDATPRHRVKEVEKEMVAGKGNGVFEHRQKRLDVETRGRPKRKEWGPVALVGHGLSPPIWTMGPPEKKELVKEG